MPVAKDMSWADAVNCGLLPEIPVAWTPKPFHRHTQVNLPPKCFLSTVYNIFLQSYANFRMWDLPAFISRDKSCDYCTPNQHLSVD